MADTQTQPTFNIQRVYLKDASLEIPNAPQIFLETEPPTVEVQLDVTNALVLDGIHEVTVTAHGVHEVIRHIDPREGRIE